MSPILIALSPFTSSDQPENAALPLPLPGLLPDPASRQQLRASWKAYVALLASSPGLNRTGPSARDMAVYALLLGKALTRVFSPVTAPAKLANGMRPYARVREVLQRLDAPPFQMTLPDLLARLQSEVVKVPPAPSGRGTRLGSAYFAQHQPLLEEAKAVTEHELEAAYALHKGTAK